MGQESIDTAYNRLVTDCGQVFVDETHTLRIEFDNRHMDMSDRFRIQSCSSRLNGHNNLRSAKKEKGKKRKYEKVSFYTYCISP